MTDESKPMQAIDLPSIESTIRYAKTWLDSDSSGMTTDQFVATCFASALVRLERIAKAATAFVDEQGKRVNVLLGHTIASADDFAGERFAELVRAVTEAGR